MLGYHARYTTSRHFQSRLPSDGERYHRARMTKIGVRNDWDAFEMRANGDESLDFFFGHPTFLLKPADHDSLHDLRHY